MKISRGRMIKKNCLGIKYTEMVCDFLAPGSAFCQWQERKRFHFNGRIPAVD